MIKIKRIYEPASAADGRRVLIDRLWPRGISKEATDIDEWCREVAPSTDLRKWFNHEPEKFEEFKRRYFKELGQNEAVAGLLEQAKDSSGTTTLLYGAKDERYNHAIVLQSYLKKEH